MSDDAPPASPPDGTDPRILTPEEDEPEVTIAYGHSTGKTYHTTDCAVVQRMSAPQDVSRSVAEWKGYTKCKRCDEREGGDGYPHPGGPEGASLSHRLHGITRARCLQIRVRLLNGGTRRSVADAVGVGSGSVGRHRTGECSCEHHGRTLDYDGDGYSPLEDEGVPRQVTGRAPIDPATCADIRDTLPRDGVSAAGLATILGVSESPVRRHGAGECTHQHDTPPVSYDASAQRWRVVADARDPPARSSGVGDD